MLNNKIWASKLHKENEDKWISKRKKKKKLKKVQDKSSGKEANLNSL